MTCAHGLPVTKSRALSGVSLVLALALLPACGLVRQSRQEGIATISGQPVELADFQEYVSGVLENDPSQDAEQPSDELMSRLLDRFLEEELIIRAAGNRGITVDEREVTEALRELQEPEVASTAKAGTDFDLLRRRMRRALVTRKFREERVLKGLSVSNEEIAAYYGAHKEEFQHLSRLVFRQILLDDPDQAKELRRELMKDTSKFQEIAEEHSLAPDKGRSRAYESRDLPPEVLEAISDVPEGGLSKVSTSALGVQIFLLEKREREREMGIEEVSDKIRVILLQEKGRKAYETVIAALREEAGLKIHTENLPFAYVKEEA